MSVLNKMLRDLEQRHGHTSPEAVAIPMTSRQNYHVIKLVLLAVFVLLFIYFFLFNRTAPQNSSSSLGLVGNSELNSTVMPATLPVGPVAEDGTIEAELATLPVEAEQPVAVKGVAMQADDSVVTGQSDMREVPSTTPATTPATDNIVPGKPMPNVAAPIPAQHGDVPAAKLEVERSKPSVAEQVDALTHQAVIVAQAGQLQQALQLWQQVQYLQPNEPAAYLAQIRLWQQLGQPGAAEQVARQGVQRGIISAPLQFFLAQQAANRGQWQQVDVLLSTAFELSQHIEYYGLKAAALQQQGQHDAALGWYSQLLQQQPQQARWWLGAALAYDSMQQREPAQLHYRQALQWGEALSSASKQFIQQRLAATE